MGQSPEELRDSIARTRNELGGTLDAIEDRVVPGRVVERRRRQMRSRWDSVKASVMGTAEDWRDGAGDATDQLGERLSAVGDRVSQAPTMARHKAEGNPFAVGLIAFGAGLLVAAAFPGTETEGQLAQKVQQAAQPVTEQAKHAGQEVVEHLREPAQQAVQDLKDTAAQGAGQVKDTAQQAAQDTKQAATEGASEVSDQARQSAQTVREQSRGN